MPLIVIVFDAHAAVTPEGKPVAVPIPVAPVVLCVILVSGVFKQRVGVDDAGSTLQQFVGPLMITLVDAAETQPPELVTVNV